MIFSVMYGIWAELTAIPMESTLQEANGAGVKGDKKFSSNLDKSLVTFHPEHHFPSTEKAWLSETLVDGLQGLLTTNHVKAFVSSSCYTSPAICKDNSLLFCNWFETMPDMKDKMYSQIPPLSDAPGTGNDSSRKYLAETGKKKSEMIKGKLDFLF